MKLLVLALTSSTLLAQPQVVADAKWAPLPRATLWAKVPASLKAAVAEVPAVPGKTPPVEILVRPMLVQGQAPDGTGSAEALEERRSAWGEELIEA